MAHILAPRSTKKSFFYVFLVWAYSNLHRGLDPDYQALSQEALKLLNAILKKEWKGIKFEMKPVC